MASERTALTDNLTSLFERPASYAELRPEESLEYLIPIDGQEDDPATTREASSSCCTKQDVSSTLIGSFTFLLYHVVFCLAQAATITRPYATHSSTGFMAKTAALGVLTAGPIFIYEIDVNAIYPASDLFLAPFLAKLAERIDQVLYENGLEDDDVIFLSTFAVATGIALLLSGLLCILAARVKVANLGSFLPYSVLCGFFTTIGLLMWTLGFNVDSGKKIGAVLQSGDTAVMKQAAIHHAPSLAIGILMHVFGKTNPFLVIVCVIGTVVGSYVVLFATGTTLAQAQAANWFYSVEDMIRPLETTNASTVVQYGPPLPFGYWNAAARGNVCWQATVSCLPTILALAFLYLIRCSLHSAALRKNNRNVTRKSEVTTPSPIIGKNKSSSLSKTVVVASNNKRHSTPPIGYILEHGYGYSQIAAALTGGIAIAPSVAASLTLFKLGAERKPPQYGSCLLVLFFYLTNFRFVEYIPKPAFSCLMVLAGLDMCATWTVGSFLKTKSKLEWMVCPILVVMAFMVGMLNAIFLGVALSTFVFAANLYHAGTVKFVGSGLTLRSTVERGVKEASWLNQNADLIQILVLQHYLFFGNSQSVLTYTTTMFEDEVQSAKDPFLLPPKPKFLILDFGLVSGMDTSAIDNVNEILEICKANKCKLFLAGLSPGLRSDMAYAGIKKQAGSSLLTFMTDLETALARAEDGLLSTVFHLEEKTEAETSTRGHRRRESQVEDGFAYALKKIDEQHNLNTVIDLLDFRDYTSPIELEAGEILYRDMEDQSGLYFVETGLMRVRHPAGHSTLNTMSLGPLDSDVPTSNLYDPTQSLGHMNARGGTIGRQVAIWKEEYGRYEQNEQTFRLARIGQGWIIGGIETASGFKSPGLYVAISKTRLHHLPQSAIREVERTNPKLAMNLYKTLSHLSTKRQEVTIRQLGQFIRIINTPPPRLRGGRSDLARLHYA